MFDKDSPVTKLKKRDLDYSTKNEKDIDSTIDLSDSDEYKNIYSKDTRV